MLLPASDGLSYREDYFDDPAGWAAIKVLFQAVFDLSIDALDLYGGHDRSSMACAFFDSEGQVVANLSAFSMPLTINGKRVHAAGWQSGAVLPAYRGQGLYRQLMQRMLTRCEVAGYEALVLLTDKPSLYAPHGFELLPQTLFRAQVALGGQVERTREIDLRVASDVALLSRLLASRLPVSEHFSVADQSRMFLLNCHIADGVRLTLMEDAGAIIAWRSQGNDTVELLDIVGPTIPDLATLAASLDWHCKEVEIGFAPDRIAAPAVSTRTDENDLVLMMRGPERQWPQSAFRLSPMADF